MHNLKEIRKDFDNFKKSLEKRSIDIDIDKFIKNSISRWPQLTLDNNFLKLNQSGIFIADEIASDLMYTK